MTVDRERSVTEAFVSLAGALASGTDMVDLLEELTGTCARLLDVASAGLLLADGRGELHIVAASSERTRDLEIFQLQRQQGPCLDCYRDGTTVSEADLTRQPSRWPQFAEAAGEAGFRSVHAIPMRLRDTTLGALGLFGTQTGSLNDDDLRLGQALADVASITIVQKETAAESSTVIDQLQTALSSRAVVEQAKGLLAQRGGLDTTDAFLELRRYARDHDRQLTDLARAVVTRQIPVEQILDHAATSRQVQDS